MYTEAELSVAFTMLELAKTPRVHVRASSPAFKRPATPTTNGFKSNKVS